MTFQEQRKERIALFRKACAANKGKEIKQVIASFCIQIGIKEELAREYFKLLREAGYVKVKEGVIVHAS